MSDTPDAPSEDYQPGDAVPTTAYPRFTTTLGVPGLTRFDRDIYEEILPQLQGRRGARVYREMRENDATIGASVFIVDSFIRQTQWMVQENPSGHPQAAEAAACLRRNIEGLRVPWTTFMSQAISFIWFGWAGFEKVYRTGKDGRLEWDSFAMRAQDTLDGWDFDEHDELRGMWQLSPPHYIRTFLPSWRMMFLRFDFMKENPEGRPLLRSAYRSWWFLKRLQELEVIGVERDLVGLPKMELPVSYFDAVISAEKQAQLDAFFKLLQQIRRNSNEGVLVPAETLPNGQPSGFKLSLIASGGARQIDVSAIIVRYEQRIAMTLLTQFLFLGMDKVGSFSLASEMTNVFAVALGAILGEVQSIVNRDPVAELMALNGFPEEAWPSWIHGDIEKTDIRGLAEALFKLAGAGFITPDTTLEDYLRTIARLPEREERAGGGSSAEREGMDEETRQREEAMLRGAAADAARTAGDDAEASSISLDELSKVIERLVSVGDLALVEQARAAFSMHLGLEPPPPLDLELNRLRASAGL